MKKNGFYIVRRKGNFQKEVAYFSGLYWYLCGNASPFLDNEIIVIEYIAIDNSEL